jgi:hypothetical protein
MALIRVFLVAVTVGFEPTVGMGAICPTSVHLGVGAVRDRARCGNVSGLGGISVSRHHASVGSPPARGGVPDGSSPRITRLSSAPIEQAVRVAHRRGLVVPAAATDSLGLAEPPVRAEKEKLTVEGSAHKWDDHRPVLPPARFPDHILVVDFGYRSPRTSR